MTEFLNQHYNFLIIWLVISTLIFITINTTYFLYQYFRKLTQPTICIIKPHVAISLQKSMEIMREIFKYATISRWECIKLTKEEAELFYEEHKGKPFFDNLIEQMTSNSIIVFQVKGFNIIKRHRKKMGNTNPKLAKKGTLRAKFGKELPHNAVHGSDSYESAINEINKINTFLESRGRYGF